MAVEVKVMQRYVALEGLLNIPKGWVVVKEQYELELQEGSENHLEFSRIVAMSDPDVGNVLTELGLTIIPFDDYMHMRAAEIKDFWRKYFTEAVYYDADGGKRSKDYKNLPTRIDEFFEYYSISL